MLGVPVQRTIEETYTYTERHMQLKLKWTQKAINLNTSAVSVVYAKW